MSEKTIYTPPRGSILYKGVRKYTHGDKIHPSHIKGGENKTGFDPAKLEVWDPDKDYSKPPEEEEEESQDESADEF